MKRPNTDDNANPRQLDRQGEPIVRRHTDTAERRAIRPGILLAFATLFLTLLLGVGTASASKQVVDFFGVPAAGIAVNNSGAGPADQGDIYLVTAQNEIRRYGHDDNGTPANIYDDSYPLLSTWGAGVQTGSTDYQVCTVPASCKPALASGGNGTLAGDGALAGPQGIAIDQDTGDLYVSDDKNHLINVYAGDGAFLRSFGFDVVESGPDNAGTGYEVCVAADGDVCKAGLAGSGVGQVGGEEGNPFDLGIALSPPDGNPATGTVFLADTGSSAQRVNTYDLDGSSPASFSPTVPSDHRPSSPGVIAVDPNGIVYASVFSKEVERYDSENAGGGGIGFLAPIVARADEVQEITVHATAGQFRLSFDPDGAGPQPPETTGDLDLDATGNPPYGYSQKQVAQALEALPSIGSGNVHLSSLGSLTIKFGGALANTDVSQLVVSNGTTPYTGGTVEVRTFRDGHSGPLKSPVVAGLAVQSAVGALYVSMDFEAVSTDVEEAAVGTIQQFGPLNPPGASAPPDAADDVHGESPALETPGALAIDESNGSLYVAAKGAGTEHAQGIYVLNDTTSGPPTVSLNSLSDVTSHSVTLHGSVNPNGPPNVGYRIEYSTDGTNWKSTPEVPVGSQETSQPIDVALDPPLGLEPNTSYHVRLVALKRFIAPVVSAEKTFTTLTGPPSAETTGSPVRTATTARLDSRVDPGNSAASYYFEYGTQGPCDANPCESTETHSAGSGNEFELVSQQLEGLQPDTTYHYRVIAGNGNAGSPVAGGDMTLTTFASEAPLSHGHLPGPPGSDRAWEQVSSPDTSGNPVNGALAISDDGDRAVFGVNGGTPLSESGDIFTRLFAERTPSGWQTKKVDPSRQVATQSQWITLWGPSDLSALIAPNYGTTGEFSVWRMAPSSPATKVYGIDEPNFGFFISASDDGSRVLITLQGSQDPAHPAPAGMRNLYDVSSGSPHLINLLPDGSVSPCSPTLTGIFQLTRSQHWVSADGSLAFFQSCGELYVREIEAETTKLISTPAVSGPQCPAVFIKSTPGAAFFLTESRLVPQDSEPSTCSGFNGHNSDVYRYDVGDGSLDCVTCVVPGLDASIKGSPDEIVVSEDGSRVYFESGARLLPGAAASDGIYRVDVASGALAYIGHLEPASLGGGNPEKIALTPDGSVAVFRSADPSLNALDGQQNAGTSQIYRYNDRDRSLLCISCPSDGSPPRGPAKVNVPASTGANNTVLDADGSDVAFTTPTSLTPADQNTARAGQAPAAGSDAYEWRDGRLLLVSDGLTNWPATEDGGAQIPEVVGVTPSGHDIFFTEAAQLTPDALDGYKRLYDARIGGGFEFPPPPKPCPLEVCQGTPKGAPEEAAPGTGSFAGVGNVTPHKAKKHKRKHKKQTRHNHRANNKRRAVR